MRQRELLAYIKENLPAALRAVQCGRRATALPQLTPTDKALLYSYSDDGYEALNRGLHASSGQNTSLFGQALAAALGKLPAYEGLVYSSTYLHPVQVPQYRARAQDRLPVSWPAFLSASYKHGTAWQYLYPPKNCLFVIQSRTGRLIEEIAKFGIDGQNEHEVLFAPNTRFEVVEVADETGYTRIVLDEL